MTNVNSVDFIPTQLFDRLRTLNPNFNLCTYLNRFRALKTNQDRVNFVYKDLKKYNLFPKFYKDKKDDATAIECRDRGNALFAEGSYSEAAIAYTRSISAAKSKGVLAIAYANRSACLFKLNMFQGCLVDIERALANNYPNRLKQKLVERRAEATTLMSPSESFHDDTPKIPKSSENPLIQSAKDCVAIGTNEKWGRHVIATRDIEIGEILSVEEPFTSTLVMEQLIHCNRCLELCYNPIPCASCTLIVFCSEQCKSKAAATYHKYECPIYFSLIACGMRSVQMMALKVALLAKGDFQKLHTLTMNPEEVYRSDRYKEIHNLMAATDEQMVHNLYEKTVLAACIFNFLQNNTTFFANSDGQTTKQDFKEVILRQLQICELNELGIQEIYYDYVQNEGQTFAIGLYAFSSLFNHSCCPNVEAFQYGSTMVMRATRTIKEGQQCCICYGMSYGTCPRESRQKLLASKFYFKCECEACENDWHESSEIASTLVKDLEMSLMELMIVEVELAAGNVEAAHHFLTKLLPLLKNHEKIEPWGNVLKIGNAETTSRQTEQIGQSQLDDATAHMATSPTVEAPTSESLSHFFLERVHEADTFFDRGEFLLRFDHLNYRDKVSLVYERLLFNHLLPEFAKDLKDDDAALRHKLNGDYHFQRGNVQRALENYTNCVATAESRGVSALAHADRSACLHKLGMRKQCLEEIERALVNGYPEESTQELIDRCEEANQLPGREGSYYEKIPEVPESQKNPIIPCASDCVRIENEEDGGYVVATRDIEIGEVISVERPYCSVVFPNDRLNYCHHCLKLCYNMIPCKCCTQALFCSEKCKEKARKLYHDYECPILLTLSSLTMKNPMVMVALRTTFLAVCDCFLLPRSEDD
ncbi:SET, TPR 11, and/or zf-MYND domain containing protein, partial [Asbolus verrucosus]